MARVVRRSWLALLVAGALAGCGSSGSPPPNALRDDLDRLCNAVVLSGAAQMEPADRAYTMANWLGQNITSDPGRKFMQDWARLGEDKPARVKMLEGAATSVGIKSCPLLDDWR